MLAHLRTTDSYTLGRSASGTAGNDDRHDYSQAMVENDNATEDESAELAAKQNTAEDGGYIRGNVKKGPIRRNVHPQIANNSSALPQKDYDDYSSEDHVPFVNLDAIQPAITDLYQQPIIGMFKSAGSNDWFIVEQHLHHYYFNKMGRELDKEDLWQPAKEDTEGLNFESPVNSGGNFKA